MADPSHDAHPPDLGPGLRVSADGPVGSLVLNRPDKLNALSTDVLFGIEAAARWFDTQRGLKVVVLWGEGSSFSSGADVAGFVTDPGDGLTARDRADAGRRAADALEAMAAITVARIQGHCIGGGVVIASACDFRIAADDASFSIPEIDLGIPLAWGGIPRLIREIGAAATRDLVMTCRRFDPVEAREIGFVQRVVPEPDLDVAVEALVTQLAGKAALPLLSTKAHINATTSQMTGQGRGWMEADTLVTALHDEESREAANRYLQGLAER